MLCGVHIHTHGCFILFFSLEVCVCISQPDLSVGVFGARSQALISSSTPRAHAHPPLLCLTPYLICMCCRMLSIRSFSERISACVRACVRACVCVRACACVRACVRACTVVWRSSCQYTCALCSHVPDICVRMICACPCVFLLCLFFFHYCECGWLSTEKRGSVCKRVCVSVCTSVH